MRSTYLPSLLLLLLLAAGRPLGAQAAGQAPVLAGLPASTRAMALGDAYMMDAGHADAVFYHPALLDGAGGFGLDYQRWGTEGSAVAVSAAVGWWGGGVAVGVQTLHFADVAPGVRTGLEEDRLFRQGSVNISERVAALGYAREVLGLGVGVVGKLLEERVGSTDGTALLVDVGVASEVGPVTAGLSWRNLGQSVTAGTTTYERPDGPTLGVGGYGREVGPLDMGAAAAVSYVGGEWLPSAGLEIGYWPIQGRTFVGRVGVQRVVRGDASPVSFGFAFWGDEVTLEWAFRPFSGVDEGGTHRFGVRWR